MQNPNNNPAPLQVIESNNFRQVVDLFDADGNLLNPNTRLTIKCSICCERDLAVVNTAVGDVYSREHHEAYTVLRCGHGFGQTCITQWLWSSTLRGHARCPTCRQDAFCPRNHIDVPEIVDGRDLRNDILKIRNLLAQNYPGAPCSHGDDMPPTFPLPVPPPGPEGDRLGPGRTPVAVGAALSMLPAVERAAHDIARIIDGEGPEVETLEQRDMVVRVHIVIAIISIVRQENLVEALQRAARG